MMGSLGKHQRTNRREGLCTRYAGHHRENPRTRQPSQVIGAFWVFCFAAVAESADAPGLGSGGCPVDSGLAPCECKSRLSHI